MDEKQREQEFTEGYNQGYLLSRFEPNLLKDILRTPQEGNPQFDGIKAGEQAHARELFAENMQKSRALQEGDKPRPRMK